MHNASKILILAADIFMTILLLTIATLFLRGYIQVANEGLDEVSSIEEEALDQDLKSLATMTLSGYDVVSNVRKYQGRMNVVVNNLAQETTYNNGNKIDNSDPLADSYVVPDDMYTCRLAINDNGVITQAKFTKVDDSVDAVSPDARLMLMNLQEVLSDCGITASSSFTEVLNAIEQNVAVFEGPDAQYQKQVLANLVGADSSDSWEDILEKTVEKLTETP